MRVLLIIILLAVVLSIAGWVSFTNSDGDPTIRVNSEKVKEDSSAIIEKSNEAINNIDRNVND